MSALLDNPTRHQFISKTYTNENHEMFCMDREGKHSGPEDSDVDINLEEHEKDQ